ncbi:5319_t:CDS:2 [Dentiscutata erythropus]|uniref:5319_t:CDS:1 n=1 Tax=Dentiscutata erythropus TaxID=1348616 RepID=A0A9N9F6M6_9GLOM|nr:5319_t:CDS:2 [Dentiscutata erythropus]
MTRTQVVCGEQVAFLKNNPDPCPLNFFKEYNYRKKLTAYNDYVLWLKKALQEDPDSEKLLELKRCLDNKKYKNDWKRYEEWKKNKNANVKKQKRDDNVSFDGQLSDELISKAKSDDDDSLVSQDSDSDKELINTDTLGYDRLVFLFNDSNKDVIVGKIDESTLEKESELPKARDKGPSKLIYADLLNAFRQYQNKIPQNHKQLSQDFANHVEWKCEPAPINIQNYFDNHCEKLDNTDENKHFDTNI